jgi:hypothetical protein
MLDTNRCRKELEKVCNTIERAPDIVSNTALRTAVAELGILVDELLNDFYDIKLNELNERKNVADKEFIKKFAKFKSWPLGIKASKNEEMPTNKKKVTCIEAFEELSCEKFDSLKKVYSKIPDLDDRTYIDLRNNGAHAEPDKPIDIDKAIVIRYFNIISEALTDLKYKDYKKVTFAEYHNVIRRRELFNYVKQFKEDYKSTMEKCVTSPETESAIEQDLYSEFKYDYSKSDAEPINLFDEICKSNDNFWITGEGGIGKTTMLNFIYQEKKKAFCNENMESYDPYEESPVNFLPIPIFVSGYRLNILSNSSKSNCFTHAINGLMDGNFNILEKANKLVELYEPLPEKTGRPVIILLLDGFNEVPGLDDERVREEFLNYCNELSNNHHIQIIVTSRTNVFRADKNVFKKKISAIGVNIDKIAPYIRQHRKDLDDTTIQTALKKKKIFDILKNPMYLRLYTKYQFDIIVKTNQEDKEKSERIKELVGNKTIVPIESNINNMCKAYILWNYVQYILYNNVFRQRVDVPWNIKKYQAEVERNQYKFAALLSRFLPKIAGKLVECTPWEMESLDDPFEKQLETFLGNNNIVLKESAMWFLTDVTGLLGADIVNGKCSIRFSHQNFRDFFATCDYTKIHLSGFAKYLEESCDQLETNHLNKHENNQILSQINQSELHNQLKTKPILSDIKMLTGELLGERDEDRSSILKNILKKCLEKNESETMEYQTIENIFEIYKSLGTLQLIEFLQADFEKLNLNDVNHKEIISFVAETLKTIDLKQLVSETISLLPEKKSLASKIMPLLQGNMSLLQEAWQLLSEMSFSEKKDVELLKRLRSILRLSAHCTNYLRKEDVREIYSVWLIWAKKSLSSMGLSNDFIAIVLPHLGYLGYQFLASENLGIGENDFLNIFKEVKESKNDFQTLLMILDKKVTKEQLQNETIVDAMYALASRNDYASNFACFLLDYYLYSLDGGLKLITTLSDNRDKEQDPVKKTMIQFRIISGINFYVQESWCNGKEINNELIALQNTMNAFLKKELENFSSEMAINYKTFKYGYYFPFGNFFAFDNGIECVAAEHPDKPKIIKQNTKTETLRKIFEGNNINLALFQKVILDIACVSTCTFFVQNEIYSDEQVGEETRNDRYLCNTFEFFEELIVEKLYPVNSTDSTYDCMTETDKIVWNSLCEALAILYHYYPSKTEAFLDRISKQYQENHAYNRSNAIGHLKDALKDITKKEFAYLCTAELKDKRLTIAKFIENYKNVLAFADLANNVLIAFPIVTETLAMWGKKSFLKNIDDYVENPENFVKQTLTELFSVLKTPETESKFVKVKEALEINIK